MLPSATISTDPMLFPQWRGLHRVGLNPAGVDPRGASAVNAAPGITRRLKGLDREPLELLAVAESGDLQLELTEGAVVGEGL